MSARGFFPQIVEKRTGRTVRCFFAVPLAQGHNKRMEFIEYIGVVRQMGHEEVLDLVVIVVTLVKPVIFQKALGISVHDKDRIIERVKQYAVRCLRPDAVYREKVIPQFLCLSTAGILDNPIEPGMKTVNECLQSF
jgi:hypothetical protein